VSAVYVLRKTGTDLAWNGIGRWVPLDAQVMRYSRREYAEREAKTLETTPTWIEEVEGEPSAKWAGDEAMRKRVAGRVAIASRTVWNIEVGPCRFRCVLDSRLCLYVMEARQPEGGYDEIGRGTDPQELLARLAFSEAAKRLLKVSP
jgi:hypothetical protein